MVTRAANAAEKTTMRGWRMAMRAAIRNVLSPTSEKRIIERDRTKECNGWMISLLTVMSVWLAMRCSVDGVFESPAGDGSSTSAVVEPDTV